MARQKDATYRTSKLTETEGEPPSPILPDDDARATPDLPDGLGAAVILTGPRPPAPAPSRWPPEGPLPRRNPWEAPPLSLKLLSSGREPSALLRWPRDWSLTL